LIYASLGTWLAFNIGRPLVALNSARQRYEADFRFSLVHLREHAESVAWYGGEPVELGLFDERMLDERAETHLLGLLRMKSWRPTVVSVGHGAVLRKFHEQTLDLCRFEAAKEAVVTQE
jgi:ABC-type uncharacterized transport system fused permease/ATPase subunit